MQTNLTWTKGIFSNLYSFYQNGELKGKLKDKTFSQTANGELQGKVYRFKTKGLLKQRTEIIDSEDKVIGEINYNTWMTKASITINGKVVNWKYNNIWNTKWSLFDTVGINIKYSGSSTKGQIDSNVDDSLLILCGLFITHYYWQMTVAILVAVIVPILTTVSN